MVALKKILLIPDVHFPYNDKRAWALMLKAARVFQPHTIVTLGDFVDFYQVSSHTKDLRVRPSLADEIAAGNAGLSQLDALGAKRKIFIEGNHCDRLGRFLGSDRAQPVVKLLKDAGVIAPRGVRDLFRLEQRKWEFVPYKSQIKIGKLFISHDYGNAGGTAHTKAEQVVGGSVVIGHTHRMAYNIVNNMQNKPHVAAMFGWLGRADETEYIHRAKSMREWALGFGVGYLNPVSNYVYLVPVPIINYTCVLNGELIDG